MRKTLRYFCIALLGVCSSLTSLAKAADQAKPNIVLVVTDDQRWDAMGCMGNPVIQTPSLDRLAKSGFVFDNMFCATSICATSRATILTGQYARRHGIWDFRTALNKSQLYRSFPMVLKRNGYQVGFVGKWGMGGEMPKGRYDYWSGFSGQGAYYPTAQKTQKKDVIGKDEAPTHLTERIGTKVLDFLQQRDGSKPFCLHVSFKAAHCQDGAKWQFQHDARLAELYKDVKIPVLPTASEDVFAQLPDFLQDSEARRRWKLRFANPEMHQESVKDYYRLISGVDRQVGRLVKALEDHKIANNTVIIFTSDNGFYLGDYGLAGKWYSHDPSIRLPLIVYDPRLAESYRGKRIKPFAMTTDLAPTIMHLAGARVSWSVQGRSLLPLLRGNTPKNWRKVAFHEHLFEHPRIPKNESIRGARYKYVRYPGRNYEELFDLKRDPHETNNLAKKPGQQKNLKRLQQQLKRKIERIKPQEGQGAKVVRLDYPKTQRGEQVDDYHGTKVSDPYRWLEELDSDQTKEWVKQQNEVTFGYLEAIPQRKQVRSRLKKLWNYERYGLPVQRGGKYFFTHNDGLQNQSVLKVADSLEAEPRTLLDPNELSKDGTVALAGWKVSPNGEMIALGFAADGSDWREWKIMDVATGKMRDDLLEWVKFSSVSWMPDNSGFFYSRYDEPKEGKQFTGTNYYHKLYFHKVGDTQSKDQLIYERTDQKEWGYDGYVTEDGEYLIISVWKGTLRKNQVFIKSLTKEDAKVVEMIPGYEAEYNFIGNNGAKLWFSTDDKAPMRRVIEVDANNYKQEDWKEVIPEARQVLESISLVGDHFVASYLLDAHSSVKVFDLKGKHVRDVEFGGIGSAGGFGGRRKSSETFYSFSSFNQPSTVYRYDVATGKATIFRKPEVGFDPDRFETRQVFFESKDGTKVPMFITSKKGLKLDGNNPTLLYAYGGFDISVTPSFSVANVVWMEMGGVYAVANLRGGGEYGRAWHEAGMLDRKQNVFDDFIGAAEWLIEEKYTSREKLAIRGGSNGGLLVGACMCQRPELFAAALPAVGVMDMLRFHKFTIGWAWVSEYGSADDAKQFETLYRYSPLHNLVPGTRYPATMVTTADHDDRVVPGHSFKFAANLQHCHKGAARPVLIRIETSAGHGAGTPTSKRIDAAADMFAFLVKELKWEPKVPTPEGDK